MQLKVTLVHGRFLNCSNGTKLHKASQLSNLAPYNQTSLSQISTSHDLTSKLHDEVESLVELTLTHYSPVLLFYSPWKQKTFRFSDSNTGL